MGAVSGEDNLVGLAARSRLTGDVYYNRIIKREKLAFPIFY